MPDNQRPTPAQIANPHNLFFYYLLARPGVAADFLANDRPPDLLPSLDVTQSESVLTSFVDDDLRQRLSDALFRARDCAGDKAFV